jgi:hypothetical protein
VDKEEWITGFADHMEKVRGLSQPEAKARAEKVFDWRTLYRGEESTLAHTPPVVAAGHRSLDDRHLGISRGGDARLSFSSPPTL